MPLPPIQKSIAADDSDGFTSASQSPAEFGDAPNPYPTLLSQNGAFHLQSNLKLGRRIDFESNGNPSSSAAGDDLHDGIENPSNPSPADEEGVHFATLAQGKKSAANIFVSGGSAASRIDGWVDFNADGDWSDPGEQLWTSAVVTNGPNRLQFTVPSGAILGATYARVRLSTLGNLAPTGSAVDGEVEDYLVVIKDANTPLMLEYYLEVDEENIRRLALLWRTGEIDEIDAVSGAATIWRSGEFYNIPPDSDQKWFRLRLSPEEE